MYGPVHTTGADPTLLTLTVRALRGRQIALDVLHAAHGANRGEHLGELRRRHVAAEGDATALGHDLDRARLVHVVSELGPHPRGEGLIVRRLVATQLVGASPQLG